MKRLRVGVVYGGRSGEHEVSLASAASVIAHLDRKRYEAVPIRIEKDGRWTLPDRPPATLSAAEVIGQARLEAARPREWAILQAGSGEAGRSMLERPHKLAIGEDSMIGWCIANGQERVACEAGEDLVRHPTPELPHTRSEAAIPMRSRGNIIGALSVQSTEPDAFDEEKIAILQALADQVAIAMDNARLFEENRLALENARRAYGNLSQAGWAKLIRTSGGLAFIGTPTRVEQTPTRLDRLSQEIRREDSKSFCFGHSPFD